MSEQHTIACQQLQALLNDDLTDLKSLQTLLSQETEALKVRSSADVTEIAQQKDTLIKALRSRAKRKASTIQAADKTIKPGEAGKFIASLKNRQLSTLHSAVNEQLALCQEKNLVVGRVLHNAKLRNEKLLTILRGQNNHDNLYAKQGQTQAINSTRSIAQA